MCFFPAAIDAFDSDDIANERSLLSTSTPSVSKLDNLAVFERDFLVALGAPLTFATLCAKVGGRIQEERIFGNCSCKHHNWMLAGTESTFLAPWKSDDPFTNRVRWFALLGACAAQSFERHTFLAGSPSLQ